ncbi:MAG: zinc ribbon domain-containing protein [Chloroflexi bacterium]|nr:zinc ribbon domain-containing protein [Chloroflexota bacterium]
MPLYEYLCQGPRHRFEVLRPMGKAEEPAVCPHCGAAGRRVLSVFASFSRSAGGDVEPVSGGGGCACASGGSCACSMN